MRTHHPNFTAKLSKFPLTAYKIPKNRSCYLPLQPEKGLNFPFEREIRALGRDGI